MAAGGLLLVMAAASAGAGLLCADDPHAIDLERRLQGPGRAGVLGADVLGRDVLSRLLHGGRISLGISLAVVGLSCSVGVLLGVPAGLRGGWPDALLMRVVDLLLAFPGILLALVLMALLGPGLGTLILALSATGWVSFARLSRALALKVGCEVYTEAARALGASRLRLVLRHVLPNIAGPVLVQATLGMAGVMLAESSLSFLGLGLPEPLASWGGMLGEGRAQLFEAPHLTLVPGLAIALSVVAFNTLGDALRDVLDPRIQRVQR
jgi:peptide/nickel transport system permease protein